MGDDVRRGAKQAIEGLYILRTPRKLRFMDAEGEAIAGLWMPGIILAATRFYVKNIIALGMLTREGVRSEA